MPGSAIEQPLALALEVIELREYARAKRLVESAPDAKARDKLPASLTRWATRIEFAAVQERRAERQALKERMSG